MKIAHTPLTVDLSATPDLVVMYFGMQASSLQGISALFELRRRVRQAVESRPDGLLHSEFVLYGLYPPNFGMRQYWRSFEDLEAWARKTRMHLDWWKGFLNDDRGVGIWHEIYCLSGGFEAVYNNVRQAVGLARFAPPCEVHGKLRLAKNRLELSKINPTDSHPEQPVAEIQ